MDIDAFINILKTLSDTKVDESVTTKALLSFEQNVCANLFSVLRNNFIQNIFVNIFKILFGLSLHETTSIKLESSRAMSIFLSRLLPFYNDLLQKSFSKAIEDLKIKTPLVPASFSFMSKHVSQPLLLQYINITPIVEQFQVNDSCFPFIIDNIGQLGTGFLQYLLKKLIVQLKTDPNRHLLRSIGSLVKHSPEIFLPQILNLDYLTLFAYVFLNVEFDHKKFDLSHVADLISKALQSEKSSPLERDCAFQVLSTLSPKVSVSENDKNLIEIEFCSTKVTIDPKKNLDRPPFFLLPLPLDLLRPVKNESVLQLSPKFKTIAKATTKENVSEILSIFREHLNLPYSEVVSSAIIGFASQPNKLRCPELINEVIYKKSVSWFHSIDILRVIKSFDIVNTHTLNLLYEFIVSGNVRLSSEAIEVVKSLTNSENSEMIENFFSQKVDLFNENIFERMITTLVAISDKTSVNSYLNFLSKILLEEIDLHKDNIRILSIIFNFLSHKDLSFATTSKLMPYCKIAVAVCEAYLASIYGDTQEAETNFNNSLNQNSNNNKNQNKNTQVNIDFKSFLTHAKKDVLSKSFDIINEYNDYHSYYPSFSAAVQFVFSLPIYVIGVAKAIDLSSKIFTFFPKLCSEFYEKNWSNIDESYKNNIMQVLFLKLQFVSDHETIAIWCRIALKTRSIFQIPQINKTVQSMNFTCATLLTPNLTDMKSAADFSAYLFVSIGEQHKKNMEVFVSDLNDEKKIEFNNELKVLFEDKVPPFYNGVLTDQNGIDKQNNSNENKDKNDEDDLPISINETGFVADLNQAILKGNSYDVIQLLKKAIDEKVSFNLFDFNFPSKMIEIISKWISFSVSYENLKKILSIEQEKFSLLDFLLLARTEWRKLVIYLIESDPTNSNQLLNELANSQKIKYNTILNVSSIVPYVYFESSELFKLAARVAMKAEKLKKMRASFLFLAHVLSIIYKSNKNGQFKPRLRYTYSVSVPDSHFVSDLNSLLNKSNDQNNKIERFSIPTDFPINYINRINSYFDSLPHKEVAFSLFQITKNAQKVDALFLFFCRKLLLAGSKYTGGVGHLCSIIITRYEELIQVNKTLTIDFDGIVQNLLNFSGSSDNESENSNNNNNNDDKSFRLFGKTKDNEQQSNNKSKNNQNSKKKNPEIYWSDDIISDAVTSPSMFMNAVRIVDSLKKFKNTLHSILSSYRFWHRIPFINHSIIKSITRDVWHERFRYMKKYFDKIDQSLPEYDTVLDFAAFILSSPELQQKDKVDEMCSRSFSIFSSTIEVPTSRELLNTALCCLIARLNFVCVSDNDKGQTMVMDALIEWLSGLDKKDGPLTLFFTFDFAKILEMKMEAQSFFALIACQYIRCAPRFFTVFPAVAKYFLKYKKCSWAAEIVKSCLPFLKSECHKKAIDCLLDENLELALKLALFEKDCDDSNKLLNLKNNSTTSVESASQTGDLIDLS